MQPDRGHIIIHKMCQMVVVSQSMSEEPLESVGRGQLQGLFTGSELALGTHGLKWQNAYLVSLMK
jgi:hypothetical protein